MRGPATTQATITIFCIFSFKAVARGLDDVSKNRLNLADVPGIRLTFIYNLFLDQFRFLGNCPPTPPLTQHFALSGEVSVNVDLGEGVGGQFPRNLS